MTKVDPHEMTSNFGLLQRIVDDADGEEDEEEPEEDGVLFYVNKNGFPIDDYTLDRMWNHVAKIHPKGYKMTHKIRNSQHLPEIAAPKAPVTFPLNTGIPQRLEMVQKYMSTLQYNHTGTQFYEIRKNRPLSGLMDTAKEMIRESLPIKCLEAIILSLYLTIGIPGLDRFPISFTTVFNGGIHRHVVLGVYCLGKYGALGMSRRDDLMYKPLEYKSLSDLIKDYKSSYEKYWHEVKRICIGLTVPHDAHSYERIHWRQLPIKVSERNITEIYKDLDRYAREMRAQTRPTTTGSSPHTVRRSLTMLSSTARPSTDNKPLSKLKKSDRSGKKKRRSSAHKKKVIIAKDVVIPLEVSESQEVTEDEEDDEDDDGDDDDNDDDDDEQNATIQADTEHTDTGKYQIRI